MENNEMFEKYSRLAKSSFFAKSNILEDIINDNK